MKSTKTVHQCSAAAAARAHQAEFELAVKDQAKCIL